MQHLPTLTLNDQHDQPQTIEDGTRYLIFAAEKAAASVVDAVLEDQTGDGLAAAGIRLVADISAMPQMVITMFALPKLRKRPYPILLGRTADDTRALPREPGKVTVMAAETGQVHFIDDVDVLRATLGLTG